MKINRRPRRVSWLVRAKTTRWTPGKNWVRTIYHYAFRWTYFFFLRPWDGVVIPEKRLGWVDRKGSDEDRTIGASSKAENRNGRMLAQSLCSAWNSLKNENPRFRCVRESLISSISQKEVSRVEELPLLSEKEIGLCESDTSSNPVTKRSRSKSTQVVRWRTDNVIFLS